MFKQFKTKQLLLFCCNRTIKCSLSTIINIRLINHFRGGGGGGAFGINGGAANDNEDDLGGGSPTKSGREQKKDKDKKNLEWRQPISERKNIWRSKFGLFADGKTKTFQYMSALQKPIDLRWSAIQKSFERRRTRKEIAYQQYIPERHQKLGNDLAAAHFIVHRGGSVKFLNQLNWVKRNENYEYQLPTQFLTDWKIEAMRCDNMELYYEGLENIRNLNTLKFLSFHNVKPFDNWCLDRVSGAGYDQLEILDVSGTEITENGLTALYRIPSLKMLIVDDPKKSIKFELICAMLEEINLDLKILSSDKIHNVDEMLTQK